MYSYKEYRKRNSVRLAVKSKKWRHDNPERYAEQMKKYRATAKNKEWRKKYMSSYNEKYYKETAEYQKQRSKNYRKLNPDKVRLAQRNWTRNKIANDLNFRLLSLFRRRMHIAIKADYGKKAYKTIELLGCSVQETRNYLEKQFREGMSWENYGKVWQIDHIMPCDSFNLTLPEDQKKCFYYKNLQPLFILENILKSNKILTG